MFNASSKKSLDLVFVIHMFPSMNCRVNEYVVFGAAITGAAIACYATMSQLLSRIVILGPNGGFRKLSRLQFHAAFWHLKCQICVKT